MNKVKGDTVISILGRKEIGEDDTGFIVPGEIIVREIPLGWTIDLDIYINGRHAGQHDGIFAHTDPRKLDIGQKVKIKGFGKAHNSWVGNIRKNFGEWKVISKFIF